MLNFIMSWNFLMVDLNIIKIKLFSATKFLEHISISCIFLGFSKGSFN